MSVAKRNRQVSGATERDMENYPNKMRPSLVTLSVGGGLPLLDRLATALLQRKMLRRVLRFAPKLEVLDPDGIGSLKVVKCFPWARIADRVMWGAWRRLPGTRRTLLPAVATCWLGDRLLSKYVPPSAIFYGLTGNCLACLRAAKLQGSLTIVESPMLHPREWQAEVMAECRHFRIHWRDCNAALPEPFVRRMQREFESCDRIVAPSLVVRESFKRHGCAEKVVVVSPGVDHVFFMPPAESRSPAVFRVCYVGRVELAKGVGYLLEAWRRLSLRRAELVLVGQILPEMTPFLSTCGDSNIRPLGLLPRKRVAEEYRRSNLSVMPSVNEGLANVLLESMACGLPVVATEKSGATDCVTEGNEGFVVPARNVDALAERILWCYLHPDEAAAMGQAARTKVEQQFTLAHYEERQLALYRSLVT